MGIGALGMMAASAATGQIMGIANDDRQFKQNKRNTELQVKSQKELTDYNQKKAMEMWEATNYKAQKEQMKKAGLNPGLLYGMGGGGGQSASVTPGSVSSGASPSSGGEMSQAMAMGMELALISAKKDLLKAQAEGTRTEADYTKGAKTDNTVANTGVQKETDKSIYLDNILKDYLMNANEQGDYVEGDLKNGILGKKAIADLKQTEIETVFKSDENARQKAMNIAAIDKIAAEINLLAAKGLTEREIMENLKKEGLILDADIAWQNVGLTKETLGQVLLGLLKGAFTGRGGKK